MHRNYLIILIHVFLVFYLANLLAGTDLKNSEIYYEPSQLILSSAMKNDNGYQRMEELCYRFGPRLSGSQNLEIALDWILKEMEKDGFDNVYSDSVFVPKWVRGKENIRMVKPWEKDLAMLGLGRSIGTTEAGLTADVIVVSDFAELDSLNNAIDGKIVLFDAPFTSLW